MDWNTFIASVGTSTTIIAVMGYVFKRLFDKSLDVLTEELKDATKARVQETSRREAALYDEQWELIKQCTSIAYRLRNNVRDLNVSTAGELDVFNTVSGESISNIQRQYKVLEELLYDSRAILPREIFEQAHELKHIIRPLLQDWERGMDIQYAFNKNEPFYHAENRYESEKSVRDSHMHSISKKLFGIITDCYQVVESLYDSLLREVNLFITRSKYIT